MTAKRKSDSSVTDLYEYTQSLPITKLMFKDVKSEGIKADDYLGKPWMLCWNPKISELCVFRVFPELLCYKTQVTSLIAATALEKHFAFRTKTSRIEQHDGTTMLLQIDQNTSGRKKYGFLRNDITVHLKRGPKNCVRYLRKHYNEQFDLLVKETVQQVAGPHFGLLVQENPCIFFNFFVYDNYDWVLAFSPTSFNLMICKLAPYPLLYWTNIQQDGIINRVINHWFRAGNAVQVKLQTKALTVLNADEYDGPILLFNAHHLDKRSQYLNKEFATAIRLLYLKTHTMDEDETMQIDQYPAQVALN